jgi:ABC-2 type transport system permease protein
VVGRGDATAPVAGVRERVAAPDASAARASRDSRLGSPASLAWLLLPRLLAARNALRRGRMRPLVLGTLMLGFWAGTFFAFERTLAYFQSLAAIGPILTQRLLFLLFLSFFGVLLLSNVVTALTTFYRAADVNLLLAAPVDFRRLHLARFVETLATSSWMVLLFGLPAFLAYGVVYRAGPEFYAGTLAALVPFLVIPAAIGVMVTTAIVLIFPARGARDAMLLASGVLSALAYVAFRLLRPERLASPSGLAGFAAFLADIGEPSPYLPTTWAGEVLLPLLRARPGEPLFHLALLASTAGVLYLASAAVVERLFLIAWSRAQQGRFRGARERPLSRWLARLTRPLPHAPRLILTKDLTVFLRDAGQWSQLVLLLALIVVYVYNFTALPIDDGSPLAATIREVASFCNLGLAAFVVTSVAVRFVYPSISLEGHSWWVLRSAPVRLTTIWWSKFWIAFLPLAGLGEVLIALTDHFLGVSTTLTLIFMATLLPTIAAVVSLGLAFGAAYPNFDSQNPAQIATSFGAVIYMVTSLGLIAAIVAILAWPISRVFWHAIARPPIGDREIAATGLAFFAAASLTVAAFELARRAALRSMALLQP